MLVEMLPPMFSGAARQAFHLATRLREQGVEVFFLGSQVTPDVPRETTIDGFRVLRVPFSRRGKWKKLCGQLGLYRILARKRREFDVLHLHGCHYLTLAAAFFTHQLLRRKVLIKLTLIDFDTPSAVRHGRYGPVAWFFYRRADAFVCMSTAQLEDCRAHGLPGHKLHKIPNGVDTRRFRPAASAEEKAALLTRLGLSTESRHGVFIGAVDQRKGIELLVEIAAQVCTARRDVKFLLIGPDGRGQGEDDIQHDYVAMIEQKIRGAGLVEHVLLLGQKANPEEYLRVAEFFLFPSVSEGFGTVQIEAMASGVPPIALQIPGVTTDIINSGKNGIVLETAAPEEAAKAILNLLEKTEWSQQLGTAARRTAIDSFDIGAVAKRYTQLYEAIVTKE
jgi:glycosyltransferase involved in cell wall biosynthesis